MHGESGGATPEASLAVEADHVFGLAQDLLKACSALNQPDDSITGQRFPIALHLLMGFAVELYLKAALAQDGMPDDQRREYKHDLKSLLEVSEQRGLLDFINIDAFRKLVNVLHDDHKRLSFRYSKPEREVQPLRSVDPAIAVLWTLHSHLGRRVSFGRQPDQAPDQTDS